MTATGLPGRPSTGVGHYLRDVVYGAFDGVVTTLAIVSGSAGAALEPRVGLILGLANLVADGLSMGASNYLSLKSELEQKGESVTDEMPIRHGLATFAAFALVGSVPLFAYIAADRPGTTFAVAAALGLFVLVVIGGLRARYVRKSVFTSALEVLAVGAAAAAAAFVIGLAAEGATR